MAKVQLTYAGGRYDRTFPLLDGSVSPGGIDLNFIPMHTGGELFRRQARHAEFDVAEFSFSTYCILRSRGDERMTAIPVFPSRKFRHGHVFVNRDLVGEPADLAGQDVGSSEYQQTAAVWIRGIFADEYGIRPESVRWVIGGLNAPKHETERVPIELPPELDIRRLPPDRWLDEMLAKGEIAAVINAQVPESLGDGGPVRRLFEDYPAVERDYYQRTGIFPIMHTVVIKRELYERHRWIAGNLLDAFQRAKELGRRQLHFGGTLYASLPWLPHHVEELAPLETEHDLFVYGVEPNRGNLETFLRYMSEQGLLDGPLAVEDLFAPEVL